MVVIEHYRGYRVEYNGLKREFQVWKGEEKILVAKTQLEIENQIDSLKDGKSKHKHLDVKEETTEMRVPDIAFWFDEEESTRFLVRMREGIGFLQLVQAYFHLLSEALEIEPDTLIGKWRK